MGVALAIGSVTAAQAQRGAPVPGHPIGEHILGALALENTKTKLPTFDNSERAGLAGVESALSIIAAKAHIDHTFCQGGTQRKPFTYTLSSNAFDTDGVVKLDNGAGFGGFSLNVRLTPSSVDLGIPNLTLGTRVDVTADPGSAIRGSTGFSSITDYVGLHHWSNGDYIFNDSADWVFTDAQSGKRIPYGERSIKDYFKLVVNQESWEFDWGLEKVLKYGYPVTKWAELSWYKRPDGGDGRLKVIKQVVKPGGGLCQIVFQGESVVDDGAFSYSGRVKVFVPKLREVVIPTPPEVTPVQ
jgi:hypothetical protein